MALLALIGLIAIFIVSRKFFETIGKIWILSGPEPSIEYPRSIFAEWRVSINK